MHGCEACPHVLLGKPPVLAMHRASLGCIPHTVSGREHGFTHSRVTWLTLLLSSSLTLGLSGVPTLLEVILFQLTLMARGLWLCLCPHFTRSQEGAHGKRLSLKHHHAEGTLTGEVHPAIPSAAAYFYPVPTSCVPMAVLCLGKCEIFWVASYHWAMAQRPLNLSQCSNATPQPIFIALKLRLFP